MHITLLDAKKIPSDCRLVMKWRNDPMTRRMFYNGEIKKWKYFWKEYQDQYFCDPNLTPKFAQVNGKKVAFLRFNWLSGVGKNGWIADIDINVAKDFRGQGMGTAILKVAAEHLFALGVKKIIVEIKKENTASIRAFERAGFIFLDEYEKHLPHLKKTLNVFRFFKNAYVRKKPAPRKKPVFIIAEAGSNWRTGDSSRDLEMSKKLIDVAVESGADAVKFQTYSAQSVYVPNAGSPVYLGKKGEKRSIFEIFEDLSMPVKMIPMLAKYCREKKIEFMSTPFSVREAKALLPFVKRFKLASYEITHFPLLEFLAKTGRPLIMSTGAADRMAIKWAVDHFFEMGGQDLTLLQCTAAYPTKLSDLNTAFLDNLREEFGLPVGLSDHSRDPIIGPLVAVAKGAMVIEKHFTLSNQLPGPDHGFALTPLELKAMVQSIRKAEQALGKHEKDIVFVEKELLGFAQRGIQAIKVIKKGDIFRFGGNIDVLRPGRQKKGLHSKYLPEIEGCRARRNIACGEGIRRNDF